MFNFLISLLFASSVFASAQQQGSDSLKALSGSPQPYERVYNPGGGSNDLRDKLDDGNTELEAKYKQDGGFFEIITENFEDPYCRNDEYTLNKMKKQLEAMGLNFEKIHQELKAYKINYVVSQYFQPVEAPQEGDLVFYPDGTQSLAGIYKNSPHGGTVLLKLYWLKSVVSQRDFFLLPKKYGDKAYFYRPMAQLAEQVLNIPSMGAFKGDTFVFDETQENRAIRDRITKLFGTALLTQFPQIIRLPIVGFLGVCSDYAFGKIAGTYSTPAKVDSDNHGCMLEHIVKPHFSITTSPTKGDLVAYFTYAESPVHWGVYMGSNYVESKWGKDYVYQHPIFYVDDGSGNYVRFYSRTSTPPGWPELSIGLQPSTQQDSTPSSSSSR